MHVSNVCPKGTQAAHSPVEWTGWVEVKFWVNLLTSLCYSKWRPRISLKIIVPFFMYVLGDESGSCRWKNGPSHVHLNIHIKNLSFIYHARAWTQGLLHPRKALYHQAAAPFKLSLPLECHLSMLRNSPLAAAWGLCSPSPKVVSEAICSSLYLPLRDPSLFPLHPRASYLSFPMSLVYSPFSICALDCWLFCSGLRGTWVTT